MSNSIRPGPTDVVGTIRHRLLINSLADPAEVAPHLPEGIRPHVSSSGGVVVGCCLIAIDSARPWPLPEAVGMSIHAVAHRISVDVGPESSPQRSVYVPCRHTNSRPAVAVGGRLFPGVHRRAAISIEETPEILSWSVSSADADQDFNISVTADIANAPDAQTEVAEIVIGTVLGVYPGHRDGSIEAADMCPETMSAKAVTLSSLASPFIEGFSTAEPAETLLMTNVGVTWRRANGWTTT